MVHAQTCSEIQQHPDFKEALERRMDVLILSAALEMRVKSKNGRRLRRSSQQWFLPVLAEIGEW